MYNLGDLVNSGKRISQANIQSIITHAKNYRLKPSFLIAQMFIESHGGDPNISIVGSIDNNWSGISEPFQVPADLGITMSRGSARPANEGGYYVHFATMNDFFKAYTYVLSKRNGLYNVEGATTIEAYCKGLFRVGGAKADYAASGYDHYLSMLRPTYNAIKQQNPGKLEAIDASDSNPIQKGEITMQCIYWRPSATRPGGTDAYYFDGTSAKYLSDNDQLKILRQIYKDNNGKDMPEYHFTSSVPWYARIEQISATKPVDKPLG